MSAARRVGAPIRLLTFTTLYPNAEQPNHGVFVENRLRHLVGSGEATSSVIAPVPFFPRLPNGFGRDDWRRYARVPARETRHRLAIEHPRYVVIPKVGMMLAPASLARSGLRATRRLLAGGLRVDAIDAHYIYPDGVAAIRIGAALGLPVVLTARGTDVNLIPQEHAGPRRSIQDAMARASALIAVSSAIRDAMIELGAAPEKVTVLRNGVDLVAFHPVDRAAARAALGLTRRTLVSVGLLIERKGHHRTIEALASMPDTDLLIAGEGPERNRLLALANRLGVGDRVRLVGRIPHAELSAFYGAADAMVLASSREGWANVLLESMACGTPVVASPIWGNPEVVAAPEAGVVAPENTPAGIADGVRRLFADAPSRQATRAYAERFGWQATTDGQLAIFRQVLDVAALCQANDGRSGVGRGGQ